MNVEQLRTLQAPLKQCYRAQQRYCVIYQTLRNRPPATVEHRPEQRSR